MVSLRSSTLLAAILATSLNVAAVSPAYAFFGHSRSPEKKSDYKRAQIDFLKRVRKTDPKSQTIARAIFNEANELGVVIARRVPMDSIPTLLKSLLIELAKDFPGQDLTILAYAPTQPPVLLGTARLNAKTRAMTYEKANHHEKAN